MSEAVLAHADYGRLHVAEPLQRIEYVKAGVPAAVLPALASDMGVTQERLRGWLGLPRATVSRKVRQGLLLSQDEGERVVGLARLIGQVELMVRESGDPNGFDAPKWLAQWLSRPNPALGGRMPGDLVDTGDGRDIVSSLLLRMQTGAYA